MTTATHPATDPALLARVGERWHSLTPRQQACVRVIWASQQERGITPTQQEIADAMGISKPVAHEHVDWCVAKGVLRRTGIGARSLVIVDAAAGDEVKRLRAAMRRALDLIAVKRQGDAAEELKDALKADGKRGAA